jgi:hypothetical protein
MGVSNEKCESGRELYQMNSKDSVPTKVTKRQETSRRDISAVSMGWSRWLFKKTMENRRIWPIVPS